MEASSGFNSKIFFGQFVTSAGFIKVDSGSLCTCVHAYVRTLVCATLLLFTCLRKRPRSSRHCSKLAVYVAEILVYRKGEGRVAPLFEKKVHGIVDVQHHAFSYKELWTQFQFT